MYPSTSSCDGSQWDPGDKESKMGVMASEAIPDSCFPDRELVESLQDVPQSSGKTLDSKACQEVLGRSSVAECLPSIHKALGSIPSIRV